jgi:serine phosphatase RsbU (regulator of sigma subunit)
MNRFLLAFTSFFYLTIQTDCTAQTVLSDSLVQVLKTSPEDTNKVNRLLDLSSEYLDLGASVKADSVARIALRLSTKLSYKRGLALSYNTISYACEDLGNYAEATKDLLIVMKLQGELGNRKGVASAYNSLGNLSSRQGNYEEALKNYQISFQIQKELGNKKGIANAYTNFGNIYYFQGNFPEALKSGLAGLKVREEIGDEKGISDSYINVGSVYVKLHNYPEALKYYNTSMRISRKLGLKPNIALNYLCIGDVNEAVGQYEEGIKNFLAGAKIFKETGDNYNLASCYYAIGVAHTKHGELSTALLYLDTAFTIQTLTGDKQGLAFTLTRLGETSILLKDTKEGRKKINQALSLAIQLKLLETKRDCYLAFASLDSLEGDWKQAFADNKHYIIYRDSLTNEANTKKTVQAQMQYDFDKKEGLAKAEQEKKDALAGEEKNRQKVITYLISSGLIIVLVLAGFIFRGYRQKQKANTIILQQKQEVERSKETIEHQKHIVEEKQKEILDSISYAQRLQKAILPRRRDIHKSFPNSFVLYRPKDIVAGDFYWSSTHRSSSLNVTFIAAADCTGHGVPGAMVSIVCSNALNRAVKEFGLTDPGLILDKVREVVIETFEKSDSEVKDGMDISLAAIDQAKGEIKWAGANNPLWYIQGGEMKEITANKQAIGKTDNPKPFTTHTLNLDPGDSIYLFTDGFPDQFGGPKGKKLKYKLFQEIIVQKHGSSFMDLKKDLETTFDDWKGELEQIDDVCVIGIKI